MSNRANSQAAAERQAKVGDMFFGGKNMAKIAAALGIPPSIVSEDLDSLRRQWYVLAKQDPDEAHGEELARSLRHGTVAPQRIGTVAEERIQDHPDQEGRGGDDHPPREGILPAADRRHRAEVHRPARQDPRLPRPSRACPTGI